MAGTLSLPTLVQKVVLDTRQAVAGAAKAEASMKGAGREASKLGSTIQTTGQQFRVGSLAVLAASAAIVVGLEKAVHAAADYATSIRRLQSFTGATAEESSKLAFVLGRLGIPVDAAIRPLSTLSKTLETGGGGLDKFFSAADLARFRTQPLIDTLLDLNTRYHELNTTQQKNALLQIALGRGALSLRRFFTEDREELKKIGDEAQRFGLVLTQDNLEAFKKFSDESRELGQAVKGLQVQVGLALIPAFEALDKGAIQLISTFNKMPAGLKAVASEALLVVTALGLLGGAISFIGKGLATLGIGKLVAQLGEVGAAFEILGAEGGIAGLLEGIGVAGVTATAGIVAVAGALGLVLGKTLQYSVEAADASQAQEDLAESATHMVDKLIEVAGGTKQGAIGANEFNKVLEQMIDNGELTDEVLDNLIGGFDLVIKAAKNGKAIAPVVKALAAGNREAAAQLAGTGEAATGAAADLAEYKDAVDSVVAGVATATTEQTKVTDATDAYAAAVRKFGVDSDQAGQKQRDLAAAVLAQQEALGQTDPAKAQEAAQKAVQDATEKTIDAMKKEAEAAEEARNKEIEANTKLIASFDLIADQVFDPGKDRAAALDNVREAEQRLADARDKIEENRRHLTRTPELDKDLADAQRDQADAVADLAEARKKAAKTSATAADTFEKNLSKNADFELEFISNLRKIADAGGTALAAELAAQGPKAAGAAAEVAAQIGTDGFARIEKEAEHAMIVAKLVADSKWDEWPANFAEKGAKAGRAAFDAIVAELQDVAREHPELKVEVDAEITKITLAREIQPGDILDTFGGISPAAIGHRGGIVTGSGIRRFHRGGLAPDEMTAILRRGEGILTPQATSRIGAPAILAANRGDFGPLAASPVVNTFNQRGGDVNVGTVVAHDYEDFRRQMERERRRAELQRI